MLNLINDQADINRIYLYAKDPYETKYQLLTNKLHSVSLKHRNDLKAFIDYCNDMDVIYEDIDEHNPIKNPK